jgi:hypothetical protein
MKTVLVHIDPKTMKIVGVWLEDGSSAYLPEALAASTSGHDVMSDRKNPDWEDWVDVLTSRSPREVWWSEKEVPTEDDAQTILNSLLVSS